MVGLDIEAENYTVHSNFGYLSMPGRSESLLGHFAAAENIPAAQAQGSGRRGACISEPYHR
jgi:hypothetical protein